MTKTAISKQRKRAGWLVIPVVGCRVLGVKVLRGYARLCDLASLSRADIYDAKDNPTGTQRDLSARHARDAYEYIQQEDIAFWPEVFLSVRESRVFKFQLRDRASGYGFLELHSSEIRRHPDEIFISRVDGNHRLYFADGSTDGYPAITKEVSFCLAIDLGLEEEIKLFRDINNNQRRMSTSHLDNIKIRLLSPSELVRRDPRLYIAKRLSSDSDSALYGIVYEGGIKGVNKIIPLRTLKTGIEYMFSRPSRLTALEDIEVQTKLIKNYFLALKKWEPAAWKEPKQYLMLRGAGLWGVCFLGAEVLDRALADGKYKVEDILRILRSGAEWDWSREGNFKGLSGRSGAVLIRDNIALEFHDQRGVSLKSLVKQISQDL